MLPTGSLEKPAHDARGCRPTRAKRVKGLEADAHDLAAYDKGKVTAALDLGSADKTLKRQARYR